MKTKLIFFQIFILLIIGCKENALIDKGGSLEPELINKFEETELDLIINPTLTNVLLIKSKEQGKVFISKNSGKTFEFIREGVRAIHFDNKLPQTIYLAVQSSIFLSNNLGTNWTEIDIPFEGFIKSFMSSFEDSILMLGLTETFPPSKTGSLWWFNRYNYIYNETNLWDYYSNVFNGESIGEINDISYCSNNNRGMWVVSENKFPGIWISEDNLNSWRIFHKDSDLIFLKHILNKNGSFGLALVKNINSNDTSFYLTNDYFKTITRIQNDILSSIHINDFKIIRENYFILSGKKLESNTSVILMSKNSGQTFEKLFEMEGDIKSIVFDELNNFIYFIRTTSTGSELYKYSL